MDHFRRLFFVGLPKLGVLTAIVLIFTDRLNAIGKHRVDGTEVVHFFGIAKAAREDRHGGAESVMLHDHIIGRQLSPAQRGDPAEAVAKLLFLTLFAQILHRSVDKHLNASSIPSSARISSICSTA